MSICYQIKLDKFRNDRSTNRKKQPGEDKKERKKLTFKYLDTDLSPSDCLNISERDHLFNHGLSFLLNKDSLEKLCSILELARHNRTKQSKDEKNKTTPHNTDNMGKLFVTLFAFAPALKTNS